MKSLILTLDYEIFFQKSGTPENSIIRPTNYLIKALEQINGKATFFVDALYLLALKRSDLIKDKEVFECIEEQLLYIVSKGHRIELHLHPHWIDAYRQNGEWVFPTYDHYKLSSLSYQRIVCLFDESVELLVTIAQKVVPDYRIFAFRAGGWCVEPFTKIQDAFQKHNIKIDSSVAPGMQMGGDVHQLDYSDLSASSHYRFSDNVRELDSEGGYWEIPVNGYYLSLLEKMFLFFASKIDQKNARIWGDGEGIRISAHRSKLVAFRDLLLKGKQFNQFSLDGYVNPAILGRKIFSSELSFISIVAHPKLLTHSSLSTVLYLGERGHKFITLQELYQQII